jgi:NAD(P)H dehydrogenase (quinone)
MSPSVPFGVTGATGAIGGRVAARLAARDLTQRLIVRDPSRAPALPDTETARAAYDDPRTLRAAFDGVETLFFVSAAEDRDRLSLHVNVVEAAVAAGVRRIVYLSFLGAAPDATFTFARDHFHTEARIRDTGLPFTFLRSSLYLDFLPWMCGDDGVIRGPAAEGHFVPVTRDDIADVAAAVLTGTGHDGLTYDITGPQRLSMQDVAQELTRVTERPISFQDETLDEARASRAHFGAPDWEVEGWVTTYAAIAKGELDVDSDAVERVAGHAPQTFRDYLAAHPESYERLRADAP